MQHPDYNGHKVFCGCNDEWFNHEVQTTIDDDPNVGTCPDCRYSPWYYLDKGHQPSSSLCLTFTIDLPSHTDTITVEVKSGDVGGREVGFSRRIEEALRSWYVGAKVERTEK